MARKPEAPSPDKPAKPRRKMTQEEQSALFIETARHLGVDESGSKFERAFEVISRPMPESGNHNWRIEQTHKF